MLKILRKFLCKKDWHKCNKEEFDGASYVGHCKYCGARCLQDSQGNWFKVD